VSTREAKATVPGVGGLVQATLVLYFTESAKYASSAHQVTKVGLHRGEVRLLLRVAKLRDAIAAKMPMITTTISSAISVKHLRLMQ